MDKRHYLLLGRVRASDERLVFSGDEARVADELMRLGLIEGSRIQAFGDTDFSFDCRGVTGNGLRALDGFAHRRRNFALRLLGWLGRAILGRIGL